MKAMKKLRVTILGLEDRSGDVVSGIAISFKVCQSGVLLLEDTVSGRSDRYQKVYEVEADVAELSIEHSRSDLAHLSITAELE